jgi:magnesium chelatase family protein
VLRVARTIADLADCERVGAGHVAEAVSLRQLDRRSGASTLASISA